MSFPAYPPGTDMRTLRITGRALIDLAALARWTAEQAAAMAEMCDEDNVWTDVRDRWLNVAADIEGHLISPEPIASADEVVASLESLRAMFRK